MRLSAAGALALLSGCLFTDPVNMRPTIQSIDVQGGAVKRGQPAKFSAVANDPEGDALTYSWAVVAGECPTDLSPASWPPHPAPGTSMLEVQAEQTAAKFCVWAFVRDHYGAEAAAHYEASPINSPPTAVLAVEQPEPAKTYPAFTTFRLSAVGSSDPENDPLTPTWSLVAPTGSKASLERCVATEERIRCLYADVDGEYDVTVVVSDQAGGATAPESTKKQILYVDPDAPPCLRLASPAFSQEPLVHVLDISNGSQAQVDAFEILKVDDDGDPFPAKSDKPNLLRFAWFVGVNEGPLAPVNNNGERRYAIPEGTYRLGDTVRVRVQISDRLTERASREFLSCGDAAFCPLADECFQRATWTVSYR
jgi:hypothetical protein